MSRLKPKDVPPPTAPIYTRALTPKEIGRAVKVLRRTRAIPQADLARRVGVSRQWLIDLEHGKPTLDLGRVLRTYSELGIALYTRFLEPAPQWTLDIMYAAEQKEWAANHRRRIRRAERRAEARMKREAEGVAASEIERSDATTPPNVDRV